jgi:mannose-6-phosphate isomerase-like protein (cupin superfamily)
MNIPKVTRWNRPEKPGLAALRQLLDAEGLDYYTWGNGPLDTYAAHTHTYDKVIYVVEGSITFGLPQSRQKLTLKAGDRLDLPAGTVHDAVVSIEGVTCLEAHK